MSVPNSRIYFCSDVYLNPSYNNTIFFDSVEAQREYFSGKVVNTFSDYTYLRKNKSIKIQCAMDTANTFSYLFFDNHSAGYTKTYYYFVTDVQYINDTTSEIFIELDVMQTYAFNYWLRPCFVDREHSATDTVGENVLDEGLDVGEMVAKTVWNTTNLDELCVVIMSTVELITTARAKIYASKYNGVFGGVGIFAADLSSFGAIGTILQEEVVNPAIVTMWMYPKALIELEEDQSWEEGAVMKQVKGVKDLSSWVCAKPTTLAGDYTPKNKKLLTYPFSFLYLNNNASGSAIYHYEKFSDPAKVEFDYAGAISPEASVRMVPLNYNGVITNFEAGLTLGSFPTCAWNEDSYQLWLAQNQNSQTLSLVTSAISIGSGAVTILASSGAGAVAGVGMIGGGIHQIASLMSQRSDKEIQPPQAKGSFSSSVNVAYGKQHFTFQQMSVTEDQARRLDEYFSMFGYKTNRVKIPNRNVRENWTYTKTVDCTVNGNLPKADIQKIESVFNHGITFWKNGDQIGNYNLSNNCL